MADATFLLSAIRGQEVHKAMLLQILYCNGFLLRFRVQHPTPSLTHFYSEDQQT